MRTRRRWADLSTPARICVVLLGALFIFNMDEAVIHGYWIALAVLVAVMVLVAVWYQKTKP